MTTSKSTRQSSPRKLSALPLRVEPDLQGLPLASPARRLCAFALDCVLLFLPSIAVTVAIAAFSLWLADPGAYRAVKTLFDPRATQEEQIESWGALAPVLVRTRAQGLPPEVAVAVRANDPRRAGEILSDYSIAISISPGDDPNPLEPGHIRIELERLVPRGLRPAALFGVAAFYFTWLTASRRRTVGKWVFGIRVRRLDDRPVSWWQSFERFGGYLASLGTIGLGLFDFWRDPNRRLAHDRIAGTVVLRTAPPLY